MVDYPGAQELEGLRGDARILAEARQRFKRGREWQSLADDRSVEDDKFANADERNMWQWPDNVREVRQTEEDERPCLTINKTRVHNDIIINEAMKNRASIKVRPTGGKATYEASQVMQSIIRRIEYISKASIAYNTCFTKQVDAGMGYVFLETAYVNERSFNQDIYIRGVRDPRCVVLDCDIREPDGSDANWGFIFENLSREIFNQKYPDYKDEVGQSTLGADDLWMTNDHILVATYYRRRGTKDLFVSYVDPESQQRVEKLKSEILSESGKDICDALMAQIDSGEIDGKTREVTNQQVEWFEIAGDCVMKKGKWLGKYIPICRCAGRETYLDGKVDWKGHTRQLIGAQRILNYNSSAQVEFGALQTKVPFTGAADSFDGQEGWKDANRKNYAYLQFNHLDNDGQPIPPEALPKRVDPPTVATAYQAGSEMAERWMMMTSGQYQAQMGEDDRQSAASGKAINERQRQGDTATYHFVEHQGDMLRFLGVQLLDLIPKIYDTQRTLHVLGEDGTKRWIMIEPNQPQAVMELKKEHDEAAEIAFNPSVGEYDCMSDPGPNYATQRQEAWNALATILQQNMELVGIVGDLLFKYGDFPGADEIMDRMRKEIQATKPYLFSEEQEPGLQALQMQLQRLGALNGELMQKLADMQLKLKGREEKRDIDAYRADTERMGKTLDFLTKVMLTPAQQLQMQHELEQQTREHVFGMLREANAAEISNEASA